MNLLIEELYNLRDEKRALSSNRFFKTGVGEYGYGDKFLGIPVPIQRQLVKKYYKNISLMEVEEMLHSEYHEVRLSSLLILVSKMKNSSFEEQKAIVDIYLNNTKYVNNWDLVDTSAPYILGAYLYENNLEKEILYELATSSNLWEQRIAILSTQYFIRKNSFDDTINISKILLKNKHDLIHKAVGWMLREVGNKNHEILYNFLLDQHKQMPRTMLRYAIEKFDKETRKKFMF